MKTTKRRSSGADKSMHRMGSFGFLDGSYKAMDLAVGAAAGVAGFMAVKWAVNKWFVTSIPAPLMKFLPALGAATTSAAFYFVEGKSNKQRAKAHAFGAAAAGLIVNTWDFVKAQFPQLSDLVAVNVPGYGFVVNDPTGATMPRLNGMGGIVIDEGSRAMNELAYSAMNESEPDYVDYGY